MSVQQSVVTRFATELGFDPHEVEHISVEPKAVHVTLQTKQTPGGDYRSVTYHLEVVRDG